MTEHTPEVSADDSYDLSDVMPFAEPLRAGDDLVMGNRFKGDINRGASSAPPQRTLTKTRGAGFSR